MPTPVTLEELVGLALRGSQRITVLEVAACNFIGAHL